MKLYYSQGACSLTIRITIHELGLNSDYEAVNLKTKQTEQGNDFLKINPKGSVPVLEIAQNEFLTENAVILQYLADTHHATQLLPAVGDFNRYRVLELVNFITTDIHKTAGTLFFSNVPEDIKESVFKKLLIQKLHFLENKLQKQFLMGDHISLADPYLFVMLFWLHKFKFDMKDFPNLSNFYERMHERESVRLSLKEEKLV